MFGSAFQKVERANQHILDMQTAFNAHREGNGYYLRSELDDDGTPIFKVDFYPSLPQDIPLIMGDAVHNLRSALDHATWDLLGFDGGTQDRDTAFPFCKGTVAEYEATCERIKTPCSDTKKFFKGFSAYPGGNGEDLFRLHELNIIDKHRKLMPILHIASLDDLKVTDSKGQIGRLCVNQFREGPSNTVRLIVDKGERLNIEADQETTATVDIFFKEVDFFKHMPIIGVLQHLSSTVERCLWQFRDFVSQREAYPSSDVGD